MLSAFFTRSSGLFFAALVLSLTPSFSATSSPPNAVETLWPEVSATVHQLTRLPGNRVLVRFIYRASDKAPEATYIADRPIKAFAPVGMAGDVSNPSGPPKQNPDVYFPYSIEKKGTVIDEATGKIYLPAEEKEGDLMNVGQKDNLQIIGPNEGFFLSGMFDCPPINQDVPPKVQKISFDLPGLKKPVRGVILPREENSPHNFFKEPRYLTAEDLKALPAPPPPVVPASANP